MQKVSIIIPVFNGEKYLDECIKSALNQTYSNIEIIVVDDGSIDKSLKIIKKYSDRIKIIKKQNGGTASALNAGINQMSGEWFKWFSQDDVLYPNSIKELIRFGESIENKKNWILVSNYHIIDSKGSIIEEFEQSIPQCRKNFDFNVVLLHHFIGNANTSFIHKSAFENFGLFNESKEILPDYELWLRFCLLYNVKIKLIPKFLLKYRKHEGSFTESTSKKRWKYMNHHVKKYVLNKLDLSNRKKYELALQKYNRKFKIKKIILLCLNYILPKKLTNKMLQTYKNLP